MADVTGARGTLSGTQSIRAVDMADTVLELEPNAAPLTVLSAKLGSEPTHNPEFSWIEDDLEPRFSAVATVTTPATTGTALVVTAAQGVRFAQHMLVKNTATGEVFRVTAVATDTLTIVRGVGTAGVGVAMTVADELMILSYAQPEGDTSRPARSKNPTKVTNYTQINRTPFEATRTWRASNTFVRPADWSRQAAKAGIEHKKDWEYIHFHGKPSEDTSSSQPRRTSGGVFHYITTNVTDAGGTMTEAEFFGAFRGAFRYGNQSSKTLFASQLFLDVINGYPRGKIVINNEAGNQSYGINVTRFVSPQGALNVVPHFLLEGAKFGGYGVILDLSQIKKRYLANDMENRNTKILENIQAPDADTRKDEYLTESGLQFGLEKSHALIVNVTG